ncbi:hypothetical protein L2E82_08649 [Cichorium intybus]|uniref:Uncharacterized protein n=1 Tax=Cichorium intybus TaxID=13427 RepID=A0ACB9G6T0_CICIN|nr:hypothetical protein L2E82_08649 [Cichorium intybus]
MEFWVVAAATGAGYVAKHWQNLSGEKDGSSKQSPLPSPRLQSDARQVFDKMPNSVFPLPKLARRCLLDKEDVDHVSNSAPTFIDKQVDQDHANEINRTQENRSYKFRTKNINIKSNLKPLVVTGDNKDLKDRKVVFMEEKENGACIDTSLFAPIGSMKLPTKPKEKFDTSNDMVSLFIGITIGILSTTMTNQHEIEYLNDLLEQAENMVRDLHNKLEKKDGFTTKKLYTEPNEIDSPKTEKFELTSDIEAELEAELERLEENMKGCTMQRLSNVVEIDSDFEADMARGDLNLDTVNWELDSQSESDPRGKTVKSSESDRAMNPVFTPNYAVSSLDLRLRLHEVIESNLQARINELESLLKNQNTQNNPRSPDPQEENSFWDFDHTRFESFSSTP